MKVLLSIGSALIGGALFFQMPATPPMKMGLWESTASIKMSGAAMPPGMSMPNMTTKVRVCMTPESYAKNLGASQRTKDCTRTNEVWGAKTFSFDLVCKGNGANGHFEITWDSKETSHATMHMVMNGGNHSMVTDSTMESHFVSTDCGNVSPDKPEITR
jgi:hypothetical protein